MRFEYSIILPDGQVVSRDVNARCGSEAVKQCQALWREASLDPLIDDARVEVCLVLRPDESGNLVSLRNETRPDAPAEAACAESRRFR